MCGGLPRFPRTNTRKEGQITRGGRPEVSPSGTDFRQIEANRSAGAVTLGRRGGGRAGATKRRSPRVSGRNSMESDEQGPHQHPRRSTTRRSALRRRRACARNQYEVGSKIVSINPCCPSIGQGGIFNKGLPLTQCLSVSKAHLQRLV